MTPTIRAADITGTATPIPVTPQCAAGALWVEVRPDLRRIHILAGDILAALGKRRDVAGKGRNQHEDVKHAVAWLRAHDINNLVITEAQHLHPLILKGLLRLAADAEVALWLLHRPPRTDAFIRALKRYAITTDLMNVPRPGVAEATPAKPPVTALPTVPADEFVTFRSTYLSQLGPDDAGRVDACFGRIVDRCERSFAESGATRETVANALYVILNDAPADAELTVAIRALQVAAWRHDQYIKVDMPRLLHSEERPRIKPCELDAAMVAYRQPYRAITAALTRAGHGVADIAAVAVEDADADGTAISVAATPVPLGLHTARAVRAQVHLRKLQGARPGDPLLPHSPKALAKALTDTATDLGIHVFGRRAERTRNHTEGALRALGVTVTRLP
jgi:hypothetical protein